MCDLPSIVRADEEFNHAMFGSVTAPYDCIKTCQWKPAVFGRPVVRVKCIDQFNPWSLVTRPFVVCGWKVDSLLVNTNMHA